jgi:uncharacterized protein involved in outer membrane biogenesis
MNSERRDASVAPAAMNELPPRTAAPRPLTARQRVGRVLGALIAVVAVLVLVVIFFPWDLLREPINRYVSEKTGRPFAITRHLEVKLGRTVTVLADGVEFGNPPWAREPHLLQADAARVQVRLWPLFSRRIEIPELQLTRPKIGLQMEPDGRRTWALGGEDGASGAAVPQIGRLVVDQGSLDFLANSLGADIRTDFAIDDRGDGLPLKFQARGTWKKESFQAQGRTGSVLRLSGQVEGQEHSPFPLDVSATAGRTSLKASGTVADLAALDGANASFDLRGANLADLYKLLGVVLPSTPQYALRGRLDKQGAVWKVSGIQGRLGSSDLYGNLDYDRSQPVAMLRGKVQSRVLNFDDLGPIIGAGPARPEARVTVRGPGGGQAQVTAVPPAPSAPSARGAAASSTQGASVQAGRDAARPGKVLPTAPLDFERLHAMNADVWYTALDIRRAPALPLDSGSVHVRLQDGLLNLDPLTIGVAGGRLGGRVGIDARIQPAAVNARLDARALQLNQLFPTVELTRSSLGKLNGRIDLAGRGNSAAQMLATADGSVGVAMGRGRISNILLEFMGLDGGEILKFLVRGDQNVQLRCAAGVFDVKKGLMSTQSIVLDTVDTVIYGAGQVNLANETLDLVFRPQPKDMSILSLRSPLRIGGSFASPSAAPDKAALAGRAGAALALGLVNPLLALAATVETGPGADTDCAQVLRSVSPAAGPAPK